MAKRKMKDVVQGVIAATMPDATAIVPTIDGATVEQNIAPIAPSVTEVQHNGYTLPVTSHNGVARYRAVTRVPHNSEGLPAGNYTAKRHFICAVYVQLCSRLGIDAKHVNGDAQKKAANMAGRIAAYHVDMRNKRTGDECKGEVNTQGMQRYASFIYGKPTESTPLLPGSDVYTAKTGKVENLALADMYIAVYGKLEGFIEQSTEQTISKPTE